MSASPSDSAASSFLLVIVATAAMTAFLLWPQPPKVPRPAAAPTALSAHVARLCPALRDAPPPTRATLGDCAVVADVKAAMGRTPALSDAELTTLRGAIARAVQEHPTACVAALAPLLTSTSDCGLVFDAVAIRILNGTRVPPDMAAETLLHPSVCQWKLVWALREAERANPTIVATVSSLTESADVDVKGAAWLALGTLERIARGASQNDIVNCIDDMLAKGLEARPPSEHIAALEAAGNAGCVKCRPALQRDVDAPDPQTRESAVAAFRFLTDKSDVETMCGILRRDRVKEVRDSAAFALRHADTFLEDRMRCLFDGATQDESKGVGTTALNSISEFAARSELAVGTTVQVARHTKHEAIRKAAISALRGVATDDAIRDVMKAR
jgi:hypothetical protein